MEILLIAVFFIGYFFITIEHQVKIDKTISALGMASICWAILKMSGLTVFEIENQALHAIDPTNNDVAIDNILLHHIGKIAEILFFLIGAMTIAEVIDM
ncbi:MAG: sodium:proton antiporter, partial [Capnocytophaga sp.]|nr:sodium:proton antiporter [Capnocytophaga sp.]